MQDPFTGQPTRLRGVKLPSAAERHGLQDDHRRRLEALDCLIAAAAECGVCADPGRDLVLLAEDEVSLLEVSGPPWTTLGDAIRAWRAFVPLRSLADFGFPADAENPLEEPNARLRRVGGGVEAWAFVAEGDGSIYKFFRMHDEGERIGSAFAFRLGDETTFVAEARFGDYRELLEKLMLIDALAGMPSEVLALTPEGILVTKQACGEPLPQGEDVSQRLPAGLIEIPSRFLRANRDHPRLFFLAREGGVKPFLVADLHARNFVRCVDGALRVIDLVAAPWPAELMTREALIADWLVRVEGDPAATALPGAHDDEL
ncbi:MAG TPA: hypothetical protein VHO24_14000 [Opitutaceae bacterium]|nr:hypothetical protein [Opitutaceae bacterium]